MVVLCWLTELPVDIIRPALALDCFVLINGVAGRCIVLFLPDAVSGDLDVVAGRCIGRFLYDVVAVSDYCCRTLYRTIRTLLPVAVIGIGGLFDFAGFGAWLYCIGQRSCQSIYTVSFGRLIVLYRSLEFSVDIYCPVCWSCRSIYAVYGVG